jgi:hypothetical protein
MRWQRLLGSAAAVVGAAAAGCEAAPPVRAGVPPVPLAALVEPAREAPAARMQMDEATPPPPPPADGSVEQTSLRSVPGQTVAVIRATVNGVPILESEVREFAIGPLGALDRLPAEERRRQEPKVLDASLDTLIERELLWQDAMAKLKKAGKKDVLDKVNDAAGKEFDRWVRAAKKDFPSDDAFKQYLQSKGTSLQGQRRLRERMFLAEEYLRSSVLRHVDRAAGHPEVLDYYRSHPEEFTRPDGVEWQDVFVLASKYPTRDEARSVAERIAFRARAGEDFVKLCLDHDDGLARDRKAAGMGTRRGEIRPQEAEAVLFQLEDGQVGPVIELREGFHVVRLVRREYAGLVPFDDKVQTMIRDKLRNEAYARERKRFLEELRKNAHVEKWRGGSNQ